jgi:bacillithiol biosynthesis cysteine-adding enzyme BshC
MFWLLLFLCSMTIQTIPREESGQFSALANRLVYRQESLSDFIQAPFSKEGFKEQISLKTDYFNSAKRDVLVSSLTNQYKKMNPNEAVLKNIESLKSENSFTVTTGHQLSLFTGPLYFVIKILHVINLAKELNEAYPDKHVVPVFWMATEDHDFEEIKTTKLFSRDFTWESGQGGAVGRMKLENWSEYIDSIRELFKNHPEGEIQKALDVYTGDNLMEACRALVNFLFANEGLVIIDGDDSDLKKEFRFVVEGELSKQKSSHAVLEMNAKLTEKGLAQQAFAREINLFHLSEGKRERLKFNEDKIEVEGIDAKTTGAWLKLFDEDPKCLSPNVILRPLYQEIILPNLCYVGGGGEMAYWLQLKGVFDAYKVPYPLIQVRNSMMVLDESIKGKMEQVEWDIHDLFGDLHALQKKYALDHADEELDFTEMKKNFESLSNSGAEIVEKVNPGMKNYFEAELTRMEKIIDGFEQKMIKSEKAKHEKSLKAMEFIFDRLFPGGGLQERSMNFFQICANGEVFSHLKEMKSAIDPFEKDFVIWSK